MAQIGSEVVDHRRSLVRLSSSSDLAASNSDCFGESFPFHDWKFEHAAHRFDWFLDRQDSLWYRLSISVIPRFWRGPWASWLWRILKVIEYPLSWFWSNSGLPHVRHTLLPETPRPRLHLLCTFCSTRASSCVSYLQICFRFQKSPFRYQYLWCYDCCHHI